MNKQQHYELSTSMFSNKTTRTHRNYTQVQIQSNSLQRSIAKLKQPECTSYVGISSVSQPRVPKIQSFYDAKLQSKHCRLQNPQQQPHFRISTEQEPQQFLLLKSYCKSQKALELTRIKYSSKKVKQDDDNCFNVSKMVEKISKKIVDDSSNIMKKLIKDEVIKRIPKKKRNINYEMDSLFHNYNGLSAQFNINPNAKKENLIQKFYTESQKESIYIKQKPKEESDSDESVAYEKFINQVDQEDIQRDVYNSNLRNPFLEDKITVKTMKMAGLLKRRFCQT